jgi:hypothetical protein
MVSISLGTQAQVVGSPREAPVTKNLLRLEYSQGGEMEDRGVPAHPILNPAKSFWNVLLGTGRRYGSGKGRPVPVVKTCQNGGLYRGTGESPVS